MALTSVLTRRSIQNRFERATTLNANEQLVLQLANEEGLGATAIAKRLNINPKTVNRRLQAAREKQKNLAALKSVR